MNQESDAPGLGNTLARGALWLLKKSLPFAIALLVTVVVYNNVLARFRRTLEEGRVVLG